jgi:DNA-binding response OmpR family regulator
MGSRGSLDSTGAIHKKGEANLPPFLFANSGERDKINLNLPLDMRKMARKILVVDDEKRIVEILKAYLEREGYQVITAYDGRSALELAWSHTPDLIILDLMLPEVSGWDVCRELRQKSDVPVIMLTARDDTTDKIVGLELGADDYVTKPFDTKEIVSRVRAVLRRSEGKLGVKAFLNVGDISIDTEKRLVCRGDSNIELTPIEFDLLKVLGENPGRVYSRMQLLDKIQGDAYEGYERTIDSHIKNLRKKLELDPEHPRYIITVYGVGYKLGEV